MSAVTLIFPHQLFKDHPAISQDRDIFLVEEELFFNQYSFNKKKLVLHRASMKYYAEFLAKKKLKVTYIDATGDHSKVSELVNLLAQKKITEIHYADVVDDWLEKRLRKSAQAAGISPIKHRTPYFLNSLEDVATFFDQSKRYFQTDFYIDQRKKRNILIEGDNDPMGGKWSYDAQNRLALPKQHVLPGIQLPDNSTYVPSAIQYVEKNFPSNYGNTQPPFLKQKGFYPVTHAEADKWLGRFFEERFQLFGAYEDAMVPQEPVLYHSAISFLMNIGLLTPAQVIEKALDAATKYSIPLNSLEGFIRQIIGWREYIRIIYEREGVLQRTTNFWNFTRKIPESFWTAQTGIEPVDIVIGKALESGYNHHIERLMVMGNFMLLCEFHPDEVYRWFMEMYIDAYDWVMVPNTYGMTQFADGGLMMTKPYISGSNYLMKMGQWKKGEWQKTWDGLFWRFMKVHQDFFRRNPRLNMLLGSFEKMSRDKQKAHIDNAENFLSSL